MPASPFCPRDGLLDGESFRCFQIVPGEFGWSEARQRCSERGGELAVVRVDALRHQLAPKVTQ